MLDRRRMRLATIAIALVGAAVVWTVATELFPYHSLNHDEAVYLQQAEMLLQGRLTLRPPVEAVFRPWFFVADGERLYPKYSPVPAAMFAVGMAVGPARLALAAIAAGNLVLVVGVVSEAFDRATGLIAGVLVAASPLFVLDSAVFLPYAPTALLNLLFAYAYLRADRTGDRRWAAVAGGAIGLAFFARPYTAVLFAAPFVGHAGWTLLHRPRSALRRQATVALPGLAGVGLALAYNAAVVGSPWHFPYEAFAPLDGLGFGQRRILSHSVEYTPELALRANRTVVALFFTEWIAGGLVTAGLAAVGLIVTLRGRAGGDGRARRLVLAGLGPSIVGGNVLFWGNYNILGDLERTGDGLVAALGPYYHFDLLLPTAAFGAVGTLWLGRTLTRRLDRRHGTRVARIGLAVAIVVGAGLGGAITVTNAAEPVATNARVTATYETAYQPFATGPAPTAGPLTAPAGGGPGAVADGNGTGTSAGAVVLLPDPYGDWLNHPFQPLRNDPDFDGPVLYALDERPMAVADAFPDRRLYRYGYRGGWAPQAGSPTAARLQRVRAVTGEAVRLNATVGVPDGARSVTVRLATGDGSVYYVAAERAATLSIALTVRDERVRLAGDVRPVDATAPTLAVDGRETVRLTVVVDYGPAGGFAYRFDLPVEATTDRVRALTPRVERCRNARACGGAAVYVPGNAPDGVSVDQELTAVPAGTNATAVTRNDRTAGAQRSQTPKFRSA